MRIAQAVKNRIKEEYRFSINLQNDIQTNVNILKELKILADRLQHAFPTLSQIQCPSLHE